MKNSIENPVSHFVVYLRFLLLASLTWSHELDLLRYGGAELVGGIAPVFALKRY